MKVPTTIISILFLGSASFYLGGCKSPSGPKYSPGPPPTTNVRYKTQIGPLFVETCAFSGCHDTSARAGDLTLESWHDAINSDSGVILAKDTVNSRLMWGIEGKNAVARMPLDRPLLDNNQINELKQWILEGAPNN